MCGICGYVSKRGEEPCINVVQRMLDSLRHRGPDGSGLFIDQRIALGHRRLSIIDLSGGSQPMCNETEDIWLSFNGEIYNYIELQKQLAALGHRFKTSSDSEVIIHAWEEWGPEAFVRFNGQWSVALWLSKKKELILSVDPYGIRPLFFSAAGGSFRFASEIKAILQDPTMPRELDSVGLTDVYSSWGLVSDHSCFREIRRLLPGTLLRYRNGQSSANNYRPATLTEPQEPIRGDLRDLVDSNLETAVNLRFTRSDVPVGAYLSGGLDSSIAVSLIRQRTDVPLKTFSLGFSDSEFDEREYQNELARDLRTEHHSVVVTAEEMMAAFPDVVWHTEQPFLRTAPIPMFLLSRLVKECGIKVVVTGEGADEFFAGYDIFKEAIIRDGILRGAPDKEIETALNNLYPWMLRAPGQAGGMGRSFFERNLRFDDPFSSHRTRWDNGTPILSLLNQSAFSSTSGPENRIELPKDFSKWSALFRSQWLEIRTLLNGYLLSTQGDRMLMANSVEGRFPFLDPRVTELTNKIPDSEKINKDLVEKWILKSTFQGKIPKRIQDRPKQPYRAPDASSIFGIEPLPWMEEILSDTYIEKTGLFNSKMVGGLFGKCRRTSGSKMSNRDNMMAVAVVSTLLLHHKFIDKPSYSEPLKPDVFIDMRENKKRTSSFC